MTTKRIFKKEIEHTDIIGRKITVGNFVATTIKDRLQVGKVLKLTPKMVKIKLLNAHTTDGYNGQHNRYPEDMAILDSEYLTFYLVKHGG